MAGLSPVGAGHLDQQALPVMFGSSPERLVRLIEAQREIAQGRSLADVLDRAVRAARAISGARYAALGVVGEKGRWEVFVHDGEEPAHGAFVGHLPHDLGLLGALSGDRTPSRLAQVADSPNSVGSQGSPSTSPFLGVPMFHTGQVIGNFYLTGRDGDPFTAEDQALLTNLAVTAAGALVQARLLEQATRRQAWLRASTDLSRDLLRVDMDENRVLQRVADEVRDLAGADVVSIVRPDGRARLTVAAISGADEVGLQGYSYLAAGSLAEQAMRSGRGIVVDRVSDEVLDGASWVHLALVVPVRTAMVFPLRGEGEASGAIVVGRLASRPFDRDNLQLAETYASHAAVAIELAAARGVRARMQVLDERNRIARDLHDQVIQRIFAAGLALQSLVPGQAPAVGARIVEVVSDLDAIIRGIRTNVLDLRHDETLPQEGKRSVPTGRDES